jgi:predicted amidophosphoribosyltransferase
MFERPAVRGGRRRKMFCMYCGNELKPDETQCAVCFKKEVTTADEPPFQYVPQDIAGQKQQRREELARDELRDMYPRKGTTEP